MSLRNAVVTQDVPFHMPASSKIFLELLPEEVTIELVTIPDLLDHSTIELAKRLYGLYRPWYFVRLSEPPRAVGNRYSMSNVAGGYGFDIETKDSEFHFGTYQIDNQA